MIDFILNNPLFQLIFLVILFIFVPIFLIKKYTKQHTYHFIAMLRTKKFIPWLDTLARIGGRAWDYMAELGILLGFGAVGFDFLFGKKIENKFARFGAFILSGILFSVFFFFQFQFLNLGANGFGVDPIYVAAVAGFFGFCGFILLFLILNTLFIIEVLLSGNKACPGVAPIIPGFEIPGFEIFVPIYVWIPLFIIMIIHEASHGVIARRLKLAVKSTGVVLLGILPIGAFVEPDEKEMEKRSEKDQLKIFSAGPTSNYVVAILCVLILFLASGFVQPWMNEQYSLGVKGVVIEEVNDKIDFCGKEFAAGANGVLEADMRILKVDDQEIKSIADVGKALALKVNSTALFTVEKDGVVDEKEVKVNEQGKVGIQVKNDVDEEFERPLESVLGLLFFDMLSWFILLNILIVVMNFLPLSILDGGRMSMIIFSHYVPGKRSMKDKKILVGSLFFFFIIALLVINALPLIINLF